MIENNEKNKEDKENYTVIGMSLGMCLGAGIGFCIGLLTKKIVFGCLGTAIGMMLGVAISALIHKRTKNQ